MANKKKPENGEDLIRQYLKDKAAGRSTFDEKSDFQKRVRSGENFGKPHDFGQSEKQKPSVPKTPDTVTKSSVGNKKMPITDNKRRDLQITQSELEKEQKPAVSEKPKSKPESKEDEARNALFAEKALAEKSRENIKKANSSALDKARNTKKSGNAQDFVNSRSEAMGKAAIRDGEWVENLKNRNIQDELKAEKERLKYQWEEAGRRYDKLSDEEKNALYKKRNSSALERARMQEVPGGSTAQETRTNIGENIKDRYYELEDELSDPTKGGEYAFLNRLRSAAGESVENLGYWLYDTFGYEPGKKVYDEGTARKIGDIADVQLQNEIAARPSQLGQDIAKAGDSIATMLSYKLLTGPISTFAGSIASEAAFGKGLAAGVNNGLSLDKAAKEVAKVAAEKGSHVANNIFTGGMAMGSFGDKYIESRNAGLDKVESSARALVAGVASYVAESLGGIGGGKSPLNAIEEEAKKKWVTAILYEALEEGGEEFAEYTMNYLADGVIDLVARGKWEQNWDWNELLESAKIASITGGLFGVSNQLMTKAFSGNAKIDEKLQDAKKEVLEDMKVTFEAEKDPAVRAAVNAQLDNIIPDSEIAAAIENNNAQNGAQSPVESTLPLVENVQAETQTQQEAPAQTEQKAPKKKPSKKEVKHEEMLDQLDVFASERKAQEAAARQEAETPAQPKQEAPQQAQKPAEVKSEAGTKATQKAPKKAPQQGTARKADRDTVKRAYKDFSNTSMKQSRFEALYNEAYNAESFEAFMKKHPSFGEKLKGAMQKAFENGQRARDGANAKAFSDNGMIMSEDDAFLLNSRKNVDSLIARYKEEADSGMYWDEAESGDAVQLRLEESEIAARREAIKKLEAYRDKNFSQKTEQKTEKQAPKKKPVSTEKKLENTIQALENYKKHLENGDMAKLEQKNPDRYSEMMYKLEQITADENGSDYFYDTDEVSVLIDKYKEKLELMRAQNGAQAENIGAQTEKVGAQSENAAKTQQISENAAKADEYSPEYQNGAKHPQTVGAMESDKQNITRAINENGALPQKKKPFSDFDRYKADNNIPSGERAALARKINDPMLGEITVAQNIANLAKDGAKFIEQDGKYYAQNKESSVRVSKSAYNYGKWLNDNGVFYTLNQNAEVPKKINGKYVSKSVTTFIASRGGTDAMVKAIAAKIESGETGYVYDRKSHNEVIRYAQDTIVDKGFDGAVEYFNEMALGDHKYTSEINTLGLMLKNIASEAYMDSNGKNKDALDLATQIQAWIATNQTNAGQITESMKIDRQLINENSEMYYQSLIESLQEKYKKRLKGKEITLDAELLRKVAETAGTKEGTKWADKLNASIANQIPATFLERFNAYRYFCMLSSFRTDAKNMISNDVQFVMAIQKNLWLSAAERIYKKKHPEYMLTTSGFKTDINKAKFAGEVFGKEDTGGNKYENKENWVKANRTNTFRGNGKLNKINFPGRMLDFMANTKTKMLSAEDAAAKKALFVNRFVQVMEANHWTVEFLSDKSNPEAIKAYEKATSIAMEEALKGTFNDQSAMVQLLTQWKNIDTKNSDTTFAAGKVAVATFIETMFPFKNVPFNIAGSAIRYSPLGLVAGVCDLKKVKNGNLDARVALENISKGMTGTTVSLGGTLLAMLGMLTLGRDEDEDKPIEEKKDTTMYLKIPDKKNGDLYIDIDWIDSVSMQLRTGLELYDIFKQKIKGKSGKESEEEIADFWGTAIGLATRGMDSFMDIGMMASFSNLLLNKSGARTFGDVITNQVTNSETQLIPRIVTDIRQALDKEKRNTYYKDKTGKDSEYPKWIQWVTSIVPPSARNQYTAAFGNREKLPARLDEWGNSLGEENAFKRAAEALIVPSKTYRANDDKVQQMLDQLDAKTDKNVFPPDYPKFITVNGEKVNLSGKEYEEVARKIGKERYKLLDELRKDREFQKLSPNEKAELIQDCYNIANEMAKYGFDDDYSISKITQDVKDAKKEKLSIPKYLRAKQAYDNMSEYEKDGVKISRSYQLADYLMNDTSTTVEEDIKIIELIERKKDKGEYKSPFENIRKVPDTSDKEMLSLYVAFRDQADKEQDLQSYMLEYGYNSEQALARYNVAKGSKTKYDDLGSTQKKKADKLLAATNKGRTANEWNEEKIALAASAVTSIGSFGTKKTLKSYIAMLMAVGFTESEAKEFYKYYA